MNDSAMATNSTPYILAVPGTDQTRELFHDELTRELAKGQVTPDYWVWSPDHGDWKQISEIPALTVSAAKMPVPPFVAPALTPLAKTVRYEPAPAPARKNQVVRRRRNVEVEDEGFPYLQVLFGILYLAVALVIAGNYLLVDKRFDDALAHTPFVLVPAHAHLGSFVQPNALVIHVLPNHELTEDNFADFLQTLAKSTPNQPFKDIPFGMVTLTSAWFSQFGLSGEDWKSLGTMDSAKQEDRRDFITDHLCNIAGAPLIPHSSGMGLIDLKAARARVWQDLTAHFLNGA